MSLRSPLSRARGLGSAKDGVHHFWVQRVTAVALIPLTLWFVFSVANLAGGDYHAVRHWVSAPSVAIMLVLFILTMLYHSALGVQVVIEDYVHHEGLKLLSLMGQKFLHAIVAAASVYAILRVAL
ncbi:succinate dehydrogenase, hydrophobic membrane anchor protein [Solimonas sp. SE-A11]|jgi:succinate dehydrogenase / fumarate reductase membrane anchor subunit|uniref:succinate dehydrogenase, hydrophobic membrane anchor protein n=1 Tax=Solimonas sp. SE-A11 TaxID=3054954 RepID=UPI00259C922E|nr:succinate dehydrogenase, hydrophobic membrane anchor protein [Solimonas sp. SE-A11]MDM4772330.1 succinate dehydrogenase, hydrophobic membrane anchor protein [Solimonas sp. SE-A11]